MELAPGKPVRRRRCWLIVAAVLVLASMVSWWYWPRGDARFVGRWHVSFHDPKSQSVFARVLVLKSNGTGETYDEDGRRHADFAWKVEGNIFREGAPSSDESLNRALERIQSCLPTSFQWILTFYAEEDIVSVGGDAIEMSVRTGGRLTYKRLPE